MLTDTTTSTPIQRVPGFFSPCVVVAYSNKFSIILLSDGGQQEILPFALMVTGQQNNNIIF
jgi:hypothetical protein